MPDNRCDCCGAGKPEYVVGDQDDSTLTLCRQCYEFMSTRGLILRVDHGEEWEAESIIGEDEVY